MALWDAAAGASEGSLDEVARGARPRAGAPGDWLQPAGARAAGERLLCELHNRMLCSEEQGVTIDHRLTDHGREYCGRPLGHPFELYLAINQIAHRRTEIGSPETNGFCERFHCTVKEEFFAVAFRKTFYESVAQLQADLDTYLAFYNRERAHQGYRTQGRTPYQAFLDGTEVSGQDAAQARAAAEPALPTAGPARAAAELLPEINTFRRSCA